MVGMLGGGGGGRPSLMQPEHSGLLCSVPELCCDTHVNKLYCGHHRGAGMSCRKISLIGGRKGAAVHCSQPAAMERAL